MRGLASGASLGLALAAIVFTQASSQERPPAFVDAATVVPGLVADMRYAGSHNFTGRPVDGYEAPRCFMTREAATALAGATHELAGQGLVFKVFDCYRPTRAVANFARWARDVNDTLAKAEFYPNVDKRTLFRDGYIASRSGHSRGSTIDLTLAKTDGTELDMGTPFDFFSPKSWTADPTVSAAQHQNRMLLANTLHRHGFHGYDKEWWHFTLRNEPFPETYFDFPIK
ncbi:MAG TPA: M15 family metallopeptidase [Xanthobacteraceae bacterium]|nr:M15 family metallopeptidase [Xanthobacteraceae bacterium]